MDKYQQIDGVEDVGAWIEQENPFVVMVQLRLQGMLTTDEMKDAFMMRRTEWVAYLREKTGLEPEVKAKSD